MHRNPTAETENDRSSNLNTLRSVFFFVKADSKAQANMHKKSPVPEPICIKSSILFSMFFVLMHIERLAMEIIPLSVQTISKLAATICVFSIYRMKSLKVKTSCCAFTMKRGQLLLKPPMFLSLEWNVPRRLLIMTLKGSFMVKCQQSAHSSECFWTVDSIRGIWTLRMCI